MNKLNRGNMIIWAIVAIMFAIGIAGKIETDSVCGGTPNYSACQLSLQAWGDENRARNAGFGIY